MILTNVVSSSSGDVLPPLVTRISVGSVIARFVSMALCRTAVSPLLMYWRDFSLALRNWYIHTHHLKGSEYFFGGTHRLYFEYPFGLCCQECCHIIYEDHVTVKAYIVKSWLIPFLLWKLDELHYLFNQHSQSLTIYIYMLTFKKYWHCYTPRNEV